MEEFMTERQIENHLVSESRRLSMPDGSIRQVRQFRLAWSVFDNVQRMNLFSAEDMIAMSWDHMKRRGEPFETSFGRVIGSIHRRVKAIRP